MNLSAKQQREGKELRCQGKEGKGRVVGCEEWFTSTWPCFRDLTPPKERPHAALLILPQPQLTLDK